MTEKTHDEIILDIFEDIKIDDRWIMVTGDDLENGNMTLNTIVGKEISANNNTFIIYYRKDRHTDIKSICLDDFIKLRITQLDKNDISPIKIDTWYKHKNLISNKFVVGYDRQKVWYRIDNLNYIVTEPINVFLKNHKQMGETT